MQFSSGKLKAKVVVGYSALAIAVLATAYFGGIYVLYYSPWTREGLFSWRFERLKINASLEEVKATLGEPDNIVDVMPVTLSYKGEVSSETKTLEYCAWPKDYNVVINSHKKVVHKERTPNS